MARRMGKTADDQYMGGGSGNWSRAPKKKTVAKRKPSGASRRTSEAVKKMKQKESSVPKPRRKPSKVATRSTSGKVSPKSGATYGDPTSKVKPKSNKPVKSGSSRSLNAKSEVKAPFRSQSPKGPKKVGFFGTASLLSSAKTRHGIARSGSSYSAYQGSKKTREYLKSKKSAKSNSGNMVLGGSRATQEKLKRTRGFGRK